MSVVTSRRGSGVSKRIKYGSVVCVSPVASYRFSSRRCTGVVFGGDRRVGQPGFGKDSLWRGATRSCALRRPTRQAALRFSSLSALRARIALGARHRANADTRLWRNQCQPRLKHGVRRHGLQRLRIVERCRRGAPLHRRQSHQPRNPVVRTVHEHGFAAHRLSRHGLGRRAFVRKLWPACIRAAGRRHRRHGPARRRTCRHCQWHRCGRQSNPDLRQQPQSRRGSADFTTQIYAYVMPTN